MEENRDDLPPKIHRFAPWRWEWDEQCALVVGLIMWGIVAGFALFMFVGALNARSV